MLALQLLVSSPSGFMLFQGRQLIMMNNTGAWIWPTEEKTGQDKQYPSCLKAKEMFQIVVLGHSWNILAALAPAYHCVSKKKAAIRRQKDIKRKHWTHAAAVWLIQVDSVWCVSIKAFTEAQHRGLPKAHQRVAYFISQVENVLRKSGRGNSEEVSESN